MQVKKEVVTRQRR